MYIVRNGISYVPGYARRCSSIQGKAAPSAEDVDEERSWDGMSWVKGIVMGRARVGGVALRRPSRRPKAPETERKQSQNVMLNGPARKSGIGAWLRMLRVLVDVLLVLLGGLLSTSRRAKLRGNGT